MPLTPNEMPPELGLKGATGFVDHYQTSVPEPKLVFGSYSTVFDHFQSYLADLQMGNDKALADIENFLSSQHFTSFEDLYKRKLEGSFAHGMRHTLALMTQKLEDLHVEHKET